jgi:hypothetical protein
MTVQFNIEYKAMFGEQIVVNIQTEEGGLKLPLETTDGESNPTSLVFRSLSIRILHSSLFTLRFIIVRILLWIPLFHLHCGVDNTENQDSRTDIERPDNRIRNGTNCRY